MRAPARSYADDIRARTDEDLAALLMLRPDLARPAPADVSGVAARASTLASTARAIDALDRRSLSVLEAAVLLRSGVSVAGLRPLLGDLLSDADLGEVLGDLWRRGLLWGEEPGLRPVSAAVDTLGPYPAGLGPSSGDLGVQVLEPEVLASAPEEVHAVLRALAWGPPIAEPPPPGTRSRTADAVRWLTRHNVLGVTESNALLVPRELGLTLRQGRSHRERDLVLPSTDTATVPAREQVNAAAGSAASELLAHCEEILAVLAVDPAPVLKGGGLAVRELRSLAADADVDPRHAAYLLELLVGAALVADDGELEPHFVPTADYDTWRESPPAQQWARLAWTWWTSTRTLHTLPPSGTGTLGPDCSWPPIRALRQDIVRLLAQSEDQAITGARMEELIRFARPRRVPRDLSEIVALTLTEMGRLGITGLGAISDAGQAVTAAGAVTDLHDAIHPHLPAPVEHVILQGDLTAVAPGPLTGHLADVMRLVADVESRGGATVYRFTAASVTRALDRGWTADELIDALTSASLTPLPQALGYLIRDEARRHGQVRIGAAATYLRSDDPARLAELRSRVDLALLQLHQISPTVLVSPVAPAVVQDVLRDCGVGGVAETASGETVHTQRRERRTVPRPAQRLTHTVLTADSVAAVVERLRSAEAAALARPAAERTALPSTDPTTALVILRECAAEQIPVWLGYAGGSGAVERVLFHPELVEGGRVIGTANGIRRTLSIHRVTGAAPA